MAQWNATAGQIDLEISRTTPSASAATATVTRKAGFTKTTDHGGPNPVQYWRGCHNTKRAAASSIFGKRTLSSYASYAGCRTPLKSTSSSSAGATKRTSAIRAIARLAGSGCHSTSPDNCADTATAVAPTATAKAVFFQRSLGGSCNAQRKRTQIISPPLRPCRRQSTLQPAVSAAQHRRERFVRPCRTCRYLRPVPCRCRCLRPLSARLARRRSV